jgi:hypothetical protein
MITKKAYYPACAIAFLAALFFGIVTIGQIYFQKDTYPVSRLFAGCDYFPIYNATLCIVRGYTIYENIWFAPTETIFKNMERLGLLDLIGTSDESWYCYPPLFAYLNSPLLFFDMDTASRIMFFLLIAAVLCAYFLTTVSFESFMDHERTMILLCGMVIVVLSHPFYFLIYRCHQVGIVFLLIGMGVYLLKRENVLCCICFALAIGMIVFPVLILIPLLLFRRYVYVMLILVFYALLILMAPDLWFEFFQRVVFERFGKPIDPIDNCSLANTCRYVIMFVNNVYSSMGLPKMSLLHVSEYALAVYALLLCAMVIADVQIRKNCRVIGNEAVICLTLMYLPFMIAIPGSSFYYNLVLLILLVPALCFMVRAVHIPVPPFIMWAIAGGVAVSQMQFHIIQSLIDVQGSFFYFFPGFGLFTVMTGCVLLKWWIACRGLHALQPTAAL